MQTIQINKNSGSAGEVESSLASQPLHLLAEYRSDSLVALVRVASFRQVVYWRQLDINRQAGNEAPVTQIERELRDNPNFQFAFSQVRFCFDAPYKLVPEPVLKTEGPQQFLEKKAGEEYVWLNTGVNDACVLFAVDSRLTEFCKIRFNTLQFSHTAALLIQQAGAGGAQLLVNCSEHHLDAALFSEAGVLQLCQRYPFVTDTDFLYYLILICERMKADRESIRLQLSGHLEEGGSLHQLLADYFRHLSFITPTQLRFSHALEALPRHRHSLLLNAVS